MWRRVGLLGLFLLRVRPAGETGARLVPSGPLRVDPARGGAGRGRGARVAP